MNIKITMKNDMFWTHQHEKLCTNIIASYISYQYNDLHSNTMIAQKKLNLLRNPSPNSPPSTPPPHPPNIYFVEEQAFCRK